MSDVVPTPMPARSSASENSSSSSPGPRQVASAALFDGAHELRIDHHGQEYRLRETRNGKLILTK